MSKPRIQLKPWMDTNGYPHDGIVIRRDRSFVWIPFDSAIEVADALIDAYETKQVEKD